MTDNPAAARALKRVPIFSDLSEQEIDEVAKLFKPRTFEPGETIVREGLGGAALFIIASGQADVTVAGKLRATLVPGNYFGEIALFDEGTRTATVTAKDSLECYGLTYWDFRPLVERNGTIGWKLLQRMAQLIRDYREN
jgi:CRP/FNR family transcriptional regulator, cyclic AMP receptor protein